MYSQVKIDRKLFLDTYVLLTTLYSSENLSFESRNLVNDVLNRMDEKLKTMALRQLYSKNLSQKESE